MNIEIIVGISVVGCLSSHCYSMEAIAITRWWVSVYRWLDVCHLSLRISAVLKSLPLVPIAEGSVFHLVLGWEIYGVCGWLSTLKVELIVPIENLHPTENKYQDLTHYHDPRFLKPLLIFIKWWLCLYWKWVLEPIYSGYQCSQLSDCWWWVPQRLTWDVMRCLPN